MLNKFKCFIYNSISFIKNYKKYFILLLVVISLILLFLPTCYSIALRLGNFFKQTTWQHLALILSAFSTLCFFSLYISINAFILKIVFTEKGNLFLLFMPFICLIAHAFCCEIFSFLFILNAYGQGGFLYYFIPFLKSSTLWISFSFIIFLAICLILGRWHSRTTPPIAPIKVEKPKRISNKQRISELEKQLAELKKDE